LVSLNGRGGGSITKRKRRLFSPPKEIVGFISHQFKVQWDRSGGIAETNSLSWSSRDSMQALDLKTLWLSNFNRSWRLDLVWLLSI